MRTHGTTKPRRISCVVVDCRQIISKQLRCPVIFANEQGPRAHRKAARQCRLPGGNLPTKQIQVGYVSWLCALRVSRVRLDPGKSLAIHGLPRSGPIILRKDLPGWCEMLCGKGVSVLDRRSFRIQRAFRINSRSSAIVTRSFGGPSVSSVALDRRKSA